MTTRKQTAKPNFCHYRTVLDRLAPLVGASGHDEAGPAIASLVKQKRLALSNEDHLSIQAEAVWHMVGRPYYKVWPNMITAMGHTNLSFSTKYLRLPYPSIAVLLPCGCSLADAVGPYIMVMKADRDKIAMTTEDMMRLTKVPRKIAEYQAKRNRDLIERTEKKYNKTYDSEIEMFYYMPSDQQGVVTIDVCTLWKDVTVEQCVQDLLAEPNRSGGNEIDNITRIHLCKVVFAVAMFGVDNHEMVMPDISRDRLIVKGRTKGQRVSERKRIERELTQCKGWRVGSEIDLPRPLVYREGQAEPTGRELEYGHVRSGHMRMQPCGKQNKDRKLIFVAPTIVRPDLPIRTRHGYRIQDKLLTT